MRADATGTLIATQRRVEQCQGGVGGNITPLVVTKIVSTKAATNPMTANTIQIQWRADIVGLPSVQGGTVTAAVMVD